MFDCKEYQRKRGGIKEERGGRYSGIASLAVEGILTIVGGLAGAADEPGGERLVEMNRILLYKSIKKKGRGNKRRRGDTYIAVELGIVVATTRGAHEGV